MHVCVEKGEETRKVTSSRPPFFSSLPSTAVREAEEGRETDGKVDSRESVADTLCLMLFPLSSVG